MNIAVDLSDEQERRLAEIASRLNIPAESLAGAAIRELVDTGDGELEQVMDRLIQKNRELYERLR